MSTKKYVISVSIILAVAILLVSIYSFNSNSVDTVETVPKTIIHTTPDKRAMSLTESAISLYIKTGSDNAFNEITFGDDHLVDEYYVFIVNAETAKIVAHGGDSKRVGVSLENQDGNPVRDIIMSESSPTGKWVKYNWTNPATGEVQTKKSFVKTYDGYIFGSGYYLTPKDDTMEKNSSNDITITDDLEMQKDSDQ